MPITLAAPIVPPSTTGYDVTQVAFDFSANPHSVTISYAPVGGGQGGAVTMTRAQFDATAGAGGMRLRCLNALAGANGLNLAGPTIT